MMMALAVLALSSCTSYLPVQFEDGKIINIESPNIELKVGDSIVIKHFMATMSDEFSFYGRYNGVLPYNPNPCSTFGITDSTKVTVCNFYKVGVVTK